MLQTESAITTFASTASDPVYDRLRELHAERERAEAEGMPLRLLAEIAFTIKEETRIAARANWNSARINAATTAGRAER
jgi:hypothetical protein